MKQMLIVDVEMICDKHLCESCPLFHKDGLHCTYDYITNKSGCPLKPIPQKMKIDKDFCLDYKALNKGYQCGWNDCLDEILGEQE